MNILDLIANKSTKAGAQVVALIAGGATVEHIECAPIPDHTTSEKKPAMVDCSGSSVSALIDELDELEVHELLMTSADYTVDHLS